MHACVLAHDKTPKRNQNFLNTWEVFPDGSELEGYGARREGWYWTELLGGRGSCGVFGFFGLGGGAGGLWKMGGFPPPSPRGMGLAKGSSAEDG